MQNQSCENCVMKDECEYHLLDYALWCMFWPDYNENSKGCE